MSGMGPRLELTIEAEPRERIYEFPRHGEATGLSSNFVDPSIARLLALAHASCQLHSCITLGGVNEGAFKIDPSSV